MWLNAMLLQRQYPEIALYHGINIEFVFDRIHCKFCAPTSMTTSRAVAESFSKGFGLILTLKMYDSDLRHFDCSWLSSYPTEEEKLFIGGYGFIKLSSIMISRIGHNYKHYVCAIGIIQNMLDGRHHPEEHGNIHHRTMKAVRNLWSSAIAPIDPIAPIDSMLLIPSYIAHLFAFFRRKWEKAIRIDIAKFGEDAEYDVFRDLIFENDERAKREHSFPVKLDLICKVFENANCVEMVNGFVFTEHTFGDLLSVLTNNLDETKNLNEIKIENASQSDESVEHLLKLNEQQFARRHWDVAYQQIECDLELQSKYVVMVRNPAETAR